MTRRGGGPPRARPPGQRRRTASRSRGVGVTRRRPFSLRSKDPPLVACLLLAATGNPRRHFAYAGSCSGPRASRRSRIDAPADLDEEVQRDAHGHQGPDAPGDRHRLVAAAALVRRRPVGPAARHGAARRPLPRAVPRRARHRASPTRSAPGSTSSPTATTTSTRTSPAARGTTTRCSAGRGSSTRSSSTSARATGCSRSRPAR